MRTDTPPVIRLEDYHPSDFLIDRVELDIRLHRTRTRVTATLALRPNPGGRPDAPLVLDGDELTLLAVSLDGQPLDAGAHAATPQSLTLPEPPRRPFTLSLETEIGPTANTKLMGLYRSGGTYCTQCEPEGFRRITYFLDRPDVLAVYRTRIEADRDEAPVLLGNGNPAEAGPVEGTDRHYAVWDDPFPKPSYLFAVVGGKLGKVAKPYRTAGGRSVEIAVFVEPGKEGRAAYALDALERSMRWDERRFGREYDLDVFNVVAVSEFNMGAMENKGLNIFNDKYVLASAETATDGDYAAIEAIVAHEYFHNWSGNRVTCRDWFQLCLKEGLTVFRDQEFSSDERSRPVHRIAEVRTLRARQFIEDAGPLAHPVRPAQYREINNFYTATVYEKGAEVVRMLKVLIGDDAFRRGMDLYFERCDGTAATVEDFLQCFADVTGRDLAPFARWYAQAGTPLVGVRGHYDEAASTYRLDFTQETPPTPGQADKKPAVIPVALGLVAPGRQGPVSRSDRISSDGVFVLDCAADSLLFRDVPPGTVPSVFRGFSAPVKVKLQLTDAELLTLLRDDADSFNRWQAAQTVAMRFLVRSSASPDASLGPAEDLASTLGAFLDDEALRDPAFAALMLTMPAETEIAGEIGAKVDPDAVHEARDVLRELLGRRLSDRLRWLRDATVTGEVYSPDAASAGRRALRNVALDLLAAGDRNAGEALACKQYATAADMTDRIAALAALTAIPGEARESALRSFAERYRDEPLILDKWFGLQAVIPEADTLDRVKRLMAHPTFSLANPNRVRSLVGSFALGNPTQFHRPDGAGYNFLAGLTLELDGANPQLAARLVTAFGTWQVLEAGRRGKAEMALKRLAEARRLSPDVGDLVQRSLA